jgi:ribosomal protein L18
MNTTAIILAIASDLNKAKGTVDTATTNYQTRLKVAYDRLVEAGLPVAALRDKGETRDAWLDGLGTAYLSKREYAAWKKDGPLRSKALEGEGNTQGLTEKGKINNRVSRRSTDIVSDLEKVFAAEGATAEEKVAAAKKGANANEPRALGIRIAEEISKLIKAIDTDAAKEKPTIKRHGEIKAILDKAADAIKIALK